MLQHIATSRIIKLIPQHIIPICEHEPKTDLGSFYSIKLTMSGGAIDLPGLDCPVQLIQAAAELFTVLGFEDLQFCALLLAFSTSCPEVIPVDNHTAAPAPGVDY